MGRYRKGAAPAYRHHKASGQAVVTIAGRQVYLGVYDSPESHREYNRLIGGLESILTAFMEHARPLACARTAAKPSRRLQSHPRLSTRYRGR